MVAVTALLLAGVLVFGFTTGLAKEKKSTSVFCSIIPWAVTGVTPRAPRLAAVAGALP